MAQRETELPQPSPFLWFDQEAEEAARFYVSVFPNSEMLGVTRYPKGGPAAGSPLLSLTTHPDTVADGRVMAAMMTMGKIDIAGLKATRDAA